MNRTQAHIDYRSFREFRLHEQWSELNQFSPFLAVVPESLVQAVALEILEENSRSRGTAAVAGGVCDKSSEGVAFQEGIGARERIPELLAPELHR